MLTTHPTIGTLEAQLQHWGRKLGELVVAVDAEARVPSG